MRSLGGVLILDSIVEERRDVAIGLIHFENETCIRIDGVITPTAREPEGRKGGKGGAKLQRQGGQNRREKKAHRVRASERGGGHGGTILYRATSLKATPHPIRRSPSSRFAKSRLDVFGAIHHLFRPLPPEPSIDRIGATFL
jgi:hypothetical protein